MSGCGCCLEIVQGNGGVGEVDADAYLGGKLVV